MSFSSLLWILLAVSVAAATAVGPAAQQQRDEQQQQQDELMPADLLPLMKPWQRCLYFCNHCFKTPEQTSELLHCANSWCLTDLVKSGAPSKEAVRACPMMQLLQ
ncbi:hypothetical protein BOX15_Mlig004613g2 [Macrostomum lignano]|uniref:Uncharacterized protein n=1 Tax=Macrostomum lignano TaxID=282301 RepID=A0A267E1B5_9PLAT|nr:hypothetical protein BOX15_Mlig004613g2 [Macrostomum lignano]